MSPPRPGSSQYGSRYSMSRTCGPRDIISLVIPRLGDNKGSSLDYIAKDCWVVALIEKGFPRKISCVLVHGYSSCDLGYCNYCILYYCIVYGSSSCYIEINYMCLS
jgi:hypothetical protein